MLELMFIATLLGFLVSLSVHVLSLFGLADIPLGSAFAAFFLINIAALVANTGVIAQRRQDYRWLPPGEFWRFISENAPGWMRRVQIGLVLYAFFNFYLTMVAVNRGAYPRLVEGAYVLERHKVVIETLTRDQYLWHASYVVRMLSAIVMSVCFAAVTRYAARWRTAQQPNPVAQPAAQPEESAAR